MLVGRIGLKAKNNFPFKADTNDKAPNGTNPDSVISIAQVAGQFNESNGAYEFNSRNDYVAWSAAFSSAVATMMASAFTLLFFLKRDSFGSGSNNIFSFYKSGYGWMQLWAESSGSKWTFYTNNGAGAPFSSYNNTAEIGVWNNFVLTTESLNADEITHKFYKNGVLKSPDAGTDVQNKPLTGSYDSFRLGCVSFAGNSGFIGKTHTIRMYDKSISRGNVMLLNAEKGRLRA